MLARAAAAAKSQETVSKKLQVRAASHCMARGLPVDGKLLSQYKAAAATAFHAR
jgi:hypothetical protein